MRVLHCIYDDPANPWVGGGGAERVLEIYRRLTDEVEVTVLAGAYPGARDTERHGVRYEFAGRRRPYLLSRASYARVATRRLEQGDYDAAVFDFSVYTPIRVPSDRPAGHVVHMPIGSSAAARFGRIVGGMVQRRELGMLHAARLVSTTSQWMADNLRAMLPPRTLVAIVGSGVNERFFSVERRERDYLLYYGRFDWYQKGLDVLLAAAEPLLDSRPDLRLVIAGRGKDATRLHAAVAASSQRSRMEVIENPASDRVLELMAGARLLVHPSRFEGYPVVPAEAMAAGVPVVATDVGAVREIMGNPPAGALVAAVDAAEVGQAADRFLADDMLRRDASHLGRERAALLTWDRVARDHLEFLHTIAADSASAARSAGR